MKITTHYNNSTLHTDENRNEEIVVMPGGTEYKLPSPTDRKPELFNSEEFGLQVQEKREKLEESMSKLIERTLPALEKLRDQSKKTQTPRIRRVYRNGSAPTEKKAEKALELHVQTPCNAQFADAEKPPSPLFLLQAAIQLADIDIEDTPKCIPSSKKKCIPSSKKLTKAQRRNRNRKARREIEQKQRQQELKYLDGLLTEQTKEDKITSPPQTEKKTVVKTSSLDVFATVKTYRKALKDEFSSIKIGIPLSVSMDRYDGELESIRTKIAKLETKMSPLRGDLKRSQKRKEMLSELNRRVVIYRGVAERILIASRGKWVLDHKDTILEKMLVRAKGAYSLIGYMADQVDLYEEVFCNSDSGKTEFFKEICDVVSEAYIHKVSTKYSTIKALSQASNDHQEVAVILGDVLVGQDDAILKEKVDMVAKRITEVTQAAVQERLTSLWKDTLRIHLDRLLAAKGDLQIKEVFGKTLVVQALLEEYTKETFYDEMVNTDLDIVEDKDLTIPFLVRRELVKNNIELEVMATTMKNIQNDKKYPMALLLDAIEKAILRDKVSFSKQFMISVAATVATEKGATEAASLYFSSVAIRQFTTDWFEVKRTEQELQTKVDEFISQDYAFSFLSKKDHMRALKMALVRSLAVVSNETEEKYNTSILLNFNTVAKLGGVQRSLEKFLKETQEMPIKDAAQIGLPRLFDSLRPNSPTLDEIEELRPISPSREVIEEIDVISFKDFHESMFIKNFKEELNDTTNIATFRKAKNMDVIDYIKTNHLTEEEAKDLGQVIDRLFFDEVAIRLEFVFKRYPGLKKITMDFNYFEITKKLDELLVNIDNAMKSGQEFYILALEELKAAMVTQGQQSTIEVLKVQQATMNLSKYNGQQEYEF